MEKIKTTLFASANMAKELMYLAWTLACVSILAFSGTIMAISVKNTETLIFFRMLDHFSLFWFGLAGYLFTIWSDWIVRTHLYGDNSLADADTLGLILGFGTLACLCLGPLVFASKIPIPIAAVIGAYVLQQCRGQKTLATQLERL